MPYTSPADVTDGNVAPASWGDSVKAATDFLANPPACRVRNSAVQSINDATETTLTFDSERFDTDSMHSTSVNTGRITFTTAGLYVVTANVGFADAADYLTVFVRIRLNGTTAIAEQRQPANAENTTVILHVSTLYKFAAADYVECRVFHNNSANAARNSLSQANWTPEFSAVWVGLG